MSQSSLPPNAGRPTASNGERVVEADAEVQTILTAFGDDDCRAILDATDDEALSANEVSEACDLALSTTYRKLDALADAGLVEERTRIRRSGKHASEYLRLVDRVTIEAAGESDLRLRITRRDPDVRERSSAPE